MDAPLVVVAHFVSASALRKPIMTAKSNVRTPNLRGPKFQDLDRMVTRQEVRMMGWDYSSTSFQRFEESWMLGHRGLRPYKSGSRSARVHYRLGDVIDYFTGGWGSPPLAQAAE